jgi:hypothetical protein
MKSARKRSTSSSSTLRTGPQIVPAALLWAAIANRPIQQAGSIDWSTGRGDRWNGHTYGTSYRTYAMPTAA